MAIALCGATPTAPPELAMTMSLVDRSPIAADHELAVVITIKNVSAETLYVDPLDVSLFVSFRLVCVATGEKNESIGEITLDEFEPPHIGAPLPPGTSISIVRHVASVGTAGIYRITAHGFISLPSSRRIDLPDSSSIDVAVLPGPPMRRMFDSCGS